MMVICHCNLTLDPSIDLYAGSKVQAGVVIAALIAILIAAFFTVVAYRRFVLGKKGKDQIPNLLCCTCQGGESDAGSSSTYGKLSVQADPITIEQHHAHEEEIGNLNEDDDILN